MSEADTIHAWWSRLRHQGMLLSPVVMVERYDEAPQPPPFPKPEKLRDAHTKFLARLGDLGPDTERDESAVLPWLDGLLEGYVGHEGRLGKKNSIPDKLTAVVRIGSRSETVRPHRVVFADAACTVPALLVMADPSPHVGRGRGRNTYARFLELLRGTGHRLGLLTNGQQFRLVYAGLDFESWCEWESERWFDGGEGTEELNGLRQLLSSESLTPVRERVSGLLDAVEESRKRQADLSSVLRENVRQAVELLLEEVSAKHRTDPLIFELLYTKASSEKLSDAEAHEALMQAAVRIVMRMVVCLFAESRRLLPVYDPIYAQSYGVRTLYELLDEAVRNEGGLHMLLNRRSAWPRLTALFRLVHGGSLHGSLPLRAYGGALFRPGKAGDPDPVSRALDILERHVVVSDATIFAVLRKLLRGPLPVIRGRAKTFVEGPVDYTDLRTEFIGLIYEGLLDYRIKRTDEETGPQVFLNLGREPVLPLVRLEEMLRGDPKGLKDLLTTLRKEKVTVSVTSEDAEEVEKDEEAEDEQDEPDEPVEPVVETLAVEDELRPRSAQDAQDDAVAWAKKASVVAGLLRKQGKKEPDTEYEKYVESESKKLIKKVVSVGEFYLVRAGNTRKGTGTFYTRPQLAVPTVHRTLEPLCYDKQPDCTLVPKKPDLVLGLKVCDPACGSASFLVAALHYLTDALYRSLCHHCNLDDPAHSTKVTLPYGKPRTGKPGEEYVPFPPNDPQDGDRFTERLKALLRRHVVERCIYGVDINSLAVELARVSLWVETLDPELPFSFLDHKIKIGNALVGCWLDRVLDYPLKAWEREGGDGKDGPRTDHIETFLKGPKQEGRRSGDGLIKKEMRQLIERGFQGQIPLFADAATTVDDVMGQARAIYEVIHEFSVNDPEARERAYRQQFEENHRLRKLKASLDEWCAVWFWPTDDDSMKHVPTPLTFHRPTPERQDIVDRLANEVRFFHWQVEFPDVFTPGRMGFDAMLGNPPWDVMKPNSQEFFTEFDPLYRTYDKQAALRQQKVLFDTTPHVADLWSRYVARFKSLGNWARHVASPFDLPLARGKQDKSLHAAWAGHRKAKGSAEGGYPFRFQGSADLNLYKLFAETFWSNLRHSGRIGVILPTGIYSDLGTRDMREQFLFQGRIDFLYAFQNEKRVFSAAHHAFKQTVLIVTKGGTTNSFSARFRLGVGDSPHAQDITDDILNNNSSGMHFTPTDVRELSPKSLSLVELRTQRDLDIFKRVYAKSLRVGDKASGWEVEYAREFDMTNDSKLFPPLDRWLSRGFQPHEMGHWVDTSGNTALPFFEGRMVGQFDFCRQRWIRGKGRTAVWENVPFDTKSPRPQFLMDKTVLEGWPKAHGGPKVAMMDITSSTNTRSMVATPTAGFPFGHSAPVLVVDGGNLRKTLLLSAALNSFVFDYVARPRVTGLHFTWFILEECPIAPFGEDTEAGERLACNAASLSLLHRRFAPLWLDLQHHCATLTGTAWKHHWAVTEGDRLRRRVEIEGLVASCYDVTPDDLEWIVRDDPTDPKSFYRVERHLPYRERSTGLAAAAFRALKEAKWSAESAAMLSNDEFFETIGIPEMTSEKAAKALHLPEPLIYKRQGCHKWEPEKFTKEDPRYGWTWDHCWQDAITLLGSEQAVKDFIEGNALNEAERSKDAARPTDLFGADVSTDLFGGEVERPRRRR